MADIMVKILMKGAKAIGKTAVMLRMVIISQVIHTMISIRF